MDGRDTRGSEPARGPDFLGGGKLEDGIGLCLSGGGFRAMLFHVGALTRLNELGLLARLDRVASVSGGSIAAGAVAVAWSRLRFDDRGVASNLREEVCDPLVALARRYVDIPAIVIGLLPRMTAARIAAWFYNRYLFRGATLQDLPERPRSTITATSLQTGALWRFAREYAAEYHLGQWPRPDLMVADVVAASAAFPPFMSPAYVHVPPKGIEALEGANLGGEGYTDRLCLTDGGVYDNLGLEPVWKRYRTILVSDGGLAVPNLPFPASNWLSQGNRVASIALQQGIFMRQRVLRGMNATGSRKVVYWGIGEGVAVHDPGNPIGFGEGETRRAAAVPTRLKPLANDLLSVVMRAGYAHSDAALRKGDLAVLAVAPSFRGLPEPS